MSAQSQVSKARNNIVLNAEQRLAELKQHSMDAADRVQSDNDSNSPPLASASSPTLSATADSPDRSASNEAVDPEDDSPEQQAKNAVLKRIFFGMFCFQILLNLVDGCLPASLVQISDEISLSYIEEGALGSLVYLGLTLSSMAAGPIFERYSVRKIISISTFCCGLFCILFGIAPYISLLLFARFGIGASLAFITIYSPVWVDEFAPRKTQTLWMSLLQLAIPLGIMVGYGCGILTSNFGHGYLAGSSRLGVWRAPFIVEGFLILPVAVMCLWIPDELLQKPTQDPSASNSSTTMAGSPEFSPIHSSQRLQRSDSTEENDSPPTSQSALERNRSTSASSPSSSSRNVTFGENQVVQIESTSSSVSPRLQPAASPSLNSSASSSPTHRQRRGSVLVGGRESMVERPTVATMKPLVAERPSGIVHQLKLLIRNRVFVWTVLGLSALFFVVTGIQFWVTPYLVLDLGENVGYVGLAFIFASATGPTVGVLFGGYVVDRAGGYQGRTQAAVALKICVSFVVVAVTCCLLCILARSLLLVIALIWITLFAGGALVPPATGILMSSVPPPMKSFASAFAQMVYNLLGYCLSPALSGLVMQVTHSRTWGFRVVLLWSLCGSVCIVFAWRAAMAAADRHAKRVATKTAELAASKSSVVIRTSAHSPITDQMRKAAGNLKAMDDLELPSAATTESSWSRSPDHVSLDGSVYKDHPSRNALSAHEVYGYSATHAEDQSYPDGLQQLPPSEGEVVIYDENGQPIISASDVELDENGQPVRRATTRLAMDADGQLVEGDDDDYWDEIPDLSQIQTQMLYHRGARMASVADFSAFLPAFLLARAGKRKDPFSNTDLLMTEDGHVLAV